MKITPLKTIYKVTRGDESLILDLNLNDEKHINIEITRISLLPNSDLEELAIAEFLERFVKKDIKRYSISSNFVGGDFGYSELDIEEDAEGEWVRFEDVIDL